MPSVERSIRPQADVPLAPFTTLGIGGRARWFVRASSADEVAAAYRWSVEENVPLFVLGGGSNVVIADAGLDGLVLQIAIRGREFTKGGVETLVRLGAGEPWDPVVAAAVSRGLAGFECLSGIPGSVGGTPIQNVGAYGQEVAAAISDVTVFDRSAARLTTMTGADCGFGYRTSRFKGPDAGRFIVCEVTFMLREGPPTIIYPDVIGEVRRHEIASPTLGHVREAVLAIRRRKGMVLDEHDPDTRSVGSFFTNPVVPAETHERIASDVGEQVPGFALPGNQVKVPAAWLIERAGFQRGYQSGCVGVSTKHPLAIINRGGATARDVLDLAARIKRRVADRFGIRLVPEPTFIGCDSDENAVYLRAG